MAVNVKIPVNVKISVNVALSCSEFQAALQKPSLVWVYLIHPSN